MPDSQELAAHTEAPPPAAISTSGTVSDVGALLGTFMTLAANPAIDADKLREIRLTVNEATARAKEEEFSRAKAAACRAMPIIRKDGRIVIAGKNGEPDRVQGHFERWPDVQRAVTPHLQANNLSLTHRIDTEDGRVIVTAILRHDNGYVEESGRMGLPLDTSGGKNNVQGAGSAQSYGMRYSTRAILGLQFEPGHDDGDMIALPDEPLNDQQQRRVAEAEALWKADPQQFEDWWAKLQPQDRAWMIQTGRYHEITGKSAGLLQARAAGHEVTPEPEPEQPVAKDPPANERETPEQWTARFEQACKDAENIDKLNTLKRRANNTIAGLASSHPTLHDRAIDAYDKARDRLFDSTGEQG